MTEGSGILLGPQIIIFVLPGFPFIATQSHANVTLTGLVRNDAA